MIDSSVAVSYTTSMYHVTVTKNAQKDLRQLPRDVAIRVLEKMQVLAENPFAPNNNVKALAGGEGYRLRVGDYRAVYYIHEQALVLELVRVKHRKEVYR